MAPASKLLYSSDGIGVPERPWMAALGGRNVLGEALEEMVAIGKLILSETEVTGEDVLRRNATCLYRLSQGWTVATRTGV